MLQIIVFNYNGAFDIQEGTGMKIQYNTDLLKVAQYDADVRERKLVNDTLSTVNEL